MSNLEDTPPIVEVSDVFGKDDFVGPPPSFQTETNSQSSATNQIMTSTTTKSGGAKSKSQPTWSAQTSNVGRIGSAPIFTTYGNGTPQTQTPIDWQTQYQQRANIPPSYNRQPIPAHVQASQTNQIPPMTAPQAHASVHVNLPTASLLQAHSSSGPSRKRTNKTVNSVPQQPPRPNIPSFTPQAVPVQSAFDDFLRFFQTAGVNSDLLTQIVNNPNIQVQLPPQNGVNPAVFQQRFHQQLESLMLQGLQTNPPFNAASNDPNAQKLFDNLIGAFDKSKQPSQVPIRLIPQTNPQAPPVIAPQPPPPTEDDMAKQDQDADAEDEEYREVETYADYAPAKLSIGTQHPDPVVETSSLSTVEPPDIDYQLKLPSDVINKARLSALQLESVIYSCQQHNKLLADGRTRRGFLIGDGAGVGKGRTIAGIIYENYLCGRKKSIWLSVSTDLKLDAERDLKDIGAKIPVHMLGKFQYGRRISVDSGVMFLTYSGLVSKSQSIRGTLGSRIEQLIAWVGAQFEGVIVFDECHKAKNISIGKNKKTQTKAAEFALNIQERLPKARVVYASATGASETKHLGYMTRLGIWGKGTPYENFIDFCSAIERRGVGAMELVAVDLKMRGSYIARQLSFKTTSFEIRVAKLDDDFKKLYDDCVDMWATALKYFNEASNYVEERKRVRTLWTSFWGAHQKFFKYLCIGAKVPLVITIAKQALEEDKCVVIGLQSTGEAKALEALEDGDINEFISTARATFESLVTNHFPAPYEGRRVRVQEPNWASKSPASSSIASAAPSTSESSTVDESYHGHDGVKFIVEEGFVKAQLEKDKLANSKMKKPGSSRTPVTKTLSKNELALAELAEQKRKQGSKSSRALRAKRRSNAKSRIKMPVDNDDSDTESSGSVLTSSSTSIAEEDDDSDETFSGAEEETSSSDDEDSDTVVESEGSDLSAIVKVRPKKEVQRPANKKEVLASESDSDIEITAVKPRPPHITYTNDVIILGSSEDDLTENENDPDDPMVKHGPRLSALREELYQLIDNLGPRLPTNTLDDLIDQLGGPSKVAEMTGRKGRIVKDLDGQVSYKNRNVDDVLENLNVAEKERFMKGEKLVAIISEAASSGISLQADKRCKNTKRRVHITIELPWSADRAIQQFGRTHRSNQLSGPQYVFVISDLAGEKRFASIVAKRLESLGALTHGDRRATSESRDLSQFNILGKYSKTALDIVCRYLESGVTIGGIRPKSDKYGEREFTMRAREAYVGVGIGRMIGSGFAAEPTATQANHFLNRILGMKVDIQNTLFQFFTDCMNRLIIRHKVLGKHDSGILELNSDSGKTRCSEPENFYLKTLAGTVKCSLRNVQVERGIAWEEAVKLLEQGQETCNDSRSGFYIHTNPLTKAKMVFLLLREQDTIDYFRNYKPNTGRQAKPEIYSIVAEKGDKCSLEEAEPFWRSTYEMTDTQCVHICFFKSCKRKEAKLKCDVGLRHRKYCVLSGGILTAWPYLERKVPDVTARLIIVRLKLDANNRVIGPIIPQDYIDRVKQILKRGEEGVEF